MYSYPSRFDNYRKFSSTFYKHSQHVVKVQEMFIRHRMFINVTSKRQTTNLTRTS